MATDNTLIGGLLTASFNDIKFFCPRCSIKFGQKNIVHQYGESDRTEVEYNGLAEDEFTLELIIYGTTWNEYKSWRDALKAALSLKTTGVLKHPIDGEIRCKVVGRPELIDSFAELGKSTFNVTFQKCSEKIYPVVSSDNSAEITSSVQTVLEFSDTYIKEKFNVRSDFVNSYQEAQNKINSISDVFDLAKGKVSIVTDYIDGINSSILKFRNDVNRLIGVPSDLAASITGLFNTINFVTSKPLDNITMLKQMFNFGQNDTNFSTLTVENKEINSNNLIINNAIKANSLALAYGCLVGIDFDTQDDLNSVRSTLNNQFDDIYENLSFEVKNSLSILSSLANIYLDTLDVDSVVDFNAELAPLSVICYNLYGSLDNYSKIRSVNKLDNNVCVKTTIKVIAD